MTIPSEMFALILKNDGYTREPSGPYVETLDPYLEAAMVPVPEVGPGQVLIKMRLSTVNPSDIHFIKGEYGVPRVRGMAAGFEGCGDVVVAGEGAEMLLGKRVAFAGTKTGTGLWAEYARAEAAGCIPVPEAMRDEDAAALYVNPLTAVGMIAEVERAGSPAVILTAAAGQLGKQMIGLAKDRGLKSIGIVRRREQAEALKEIGATHAVATESPSFAAELAAAIRAEKPLVMLDAVADQVSAQVFFAMPRRARWVIYGLLDTHPTVLDQLGQLIFLGKSISGFWLSYWLLEIDDATRRAAFQEVFKRFLDGSWTTDVRTKIPLRRAHELLPAAVGKPNVGKIMLCP